MGSKEAVTLVVGSDSFIGGALKLHLQSCGGRVVGTTRRHESVDNDHLYLNLSHDMDDWTCPLPIDVAVICIGISKIKFCRENSVETVRINVESILKLIKNLISKGVFVIYLSTNRVFDGFNPHVHPDEPYSPTTEYGRQKAEVESKIREWGNSISIIRLTKVLGPEDRLFSLWIQTLDRGEAIQPLKDLLMAPVLLSDVVSILDIVIKKRLSGIFQVSSSNEISYVEAARLGAKLLNVDENLIQPVGASQSGHDVEPVPTHSTLNTDRLKKELGVELPDACQVVEKTFVLCLKQFKKLTEGDLHWQ
jgi:dTDP-4-dehydrorhamnose reductase